MIETINERKAMLRDFGETITGNSQRTGLFSFVGIFDNDHELVAGQTMDFSVQRPRITCATAEVAGLAVGDFVTVRNGSYQVVVVMPDGTGFTELVLEQQ